MSEKRTGWFVTVGALVGFPLLVMMLVAVPRCMGADSWVEAPRRGALRWALDEYEAIDFEGRPMLLIADASVKAGGDSPSREVHRFTLVDRSTGEVTGRHHHFEAWRPVAVRAARLWARQREDWSAFVLPELEPVADLEALIDAHSELAWEDVEEVAMPGDTETVRMLARDGFLWDLHPDLTTLERLHHDTPIPSTPDFGHPTVRCVADPVEVPSGRQALLGSHSRRPALRVADSPHALEAQEVETPHQGFLDGVFLCEGWRDPITRAPEDVFIWHTREHDGAAEVRLSRVSLTGGLRWTRGESEWLGGTTDDDSTLVRVEDRGESLLLWLVRTRGYDTTGYHFLVDVDAETGAARWVSPL